jgi:hypothetical protein
MTELVTLTRPATPARFQWLLLAVFAVGCGLGMSWPGHGGQLFGIGAMAGIWAGFVTGAGAAPTSWLVPTLIGGLPILWFLGRLLDRLQTDLRLWLLLAAVGAIVAGYLLLQRHADLAGAIEWHGSWLAHGVCAVQLGSYAATLLALMLGSFGEAGR